MKASITLLPVLRIYSGCNSLSVLVFGLSTAIVELSTVYNSRAAVEFVKVWLSASLKTVKSGGT